jgi:hypothetical protein
MTPWQVMVDIHNTLINTAMMRWGTEEQKQKYLPLFASEAQPYPCPCHCPYPYPYAYTDPIGGIGKLRSV